MKTNGVKMSVHSKKFGILSFLIFVAMIFTAIVYNVKTESVYAMNSEQVVIAENASEMQENATQVYSYIDVFESYYDQVIDAAGEKEEVISFEEFCDNYYTSGMNLTDYTALLCVAYSGGNIEGDGAIGIAPLSSSPDADYFFTSDYYNVIPQSVFRRRPHYQAFDWAQVQKGDLVYEAKAIGGFGHIAIVVDTQKSSVYGNVVQTIEAVANVPIRYGFVDDTRMVDFGVIILRVNNATQSDCDSAVDFCIQQVGKPYSLDILRKNTSIHSESWYCSELVNAAYKYVGFTLSGTLILTPGSIYAGGATSSALHYNYVQLNLTVVGKSGSYWKIKITHNQSNNVTIYYNAKMAFESDAKNWTGLKHQTEVSVPAGNVGVNVDIQTNIFATHITLSLCDQAGLQRFITYADSLNSANKTLSVYYNYIRPPQF